MVRAFQPHLFYASNNPMLCRRNVMSHAVTHWKRTIKSAHFAPNSRLTEAIAATHGVYRRQKTKRHSAANGVRVLTSASGVPKRTIIVDTTLSFAINPVIKAVETRQSPKPRGAKTGAINPAITERILSLESLTTFKCRLKLCKNQIAIVARKIMVNAFCKKSFAFSQSSCKTLSLLSRLPCCV